MKVSREWSKVEEGFQSWMVLITKKCKWFDIDSSIWKADNNSSPECQFHVNSIGMEASPETLTSWRIFGISVGVSTSWQGTWLNPRDIHQRSKHRGEPYNFLITFSNQQTSLPNVAQMMAIFFLYNSHLPLSWHLTILLTLSFSRNSRHASFFFVTQDFLTRMHLLNDRRCYLRYWSTLSSKLLEQLSHQDSYDTHFQ